MRRPSGFLWLIRPVNCLMMGFAVLVGASIGGKGTPPPDILMDLFLGFLTAFTLTGASMAINDYYDREIDAINEPNRPIPSGLIHPSEALLLALFLSAVGFLAAFLINASCLAGAVIAWIMFVTYTTKGKRTGLPGNFLVSACVAIPFIYGGLTVGRSLELTIMFAAVAFLSNTGREVTKGIVDVRGDRSQNVRTIAASHGERVAALVASIFYISAVCLSVLPWLWGLVSLWFLPLVVLTDIGFIASSVLLIRDHSRENARRIKNSVLVWMMFGLLAFIAGTIG